MEGFSWPSYEHYPPSVFIPHLQPFLLEGFKCDLRIYVLVTSCNPLRIFVYKDGLVCVSKAVIDCLVCMHIFIASSEG